MDETIFAYSEGSLGYDPKTFMITFKLTKDGTELPEVHSGIVPEKAGTKERADIYESAQSLISGAIKEMLKAEAEANVVVQTFDPSKFSIN